jgi:membrane protein
MAGLAWELARRLYGGIASLFFSANPLYGSLGVAPLFLMWIYIGWYIVLSGARLAYAVEHADFHQEFADLLAHPRSQELIATRIAAVVSAAALKGEPGPTARVIAVELTMPEQRIIDLLHRLQTAGLVVIERGAVKPAREPSALTLADISAAVGGSAGLLRRERALHPSRFEDAARLFTLSDEASVEMLKGISWADLGADRAPLQKP